MIALLLFAVQTARLMTIGADGSDPKLVHETTEHIEAPNWSPDGKWLVFNAGGKLFRIAVAGGKPEEIDTGGIGGANNDHVIRGKEVFFSAKGHIYVVPTAGGTARKISNDGGLTYWLHGISPDGKTAAFCGMGADKNKDIWTIPTAGGKDVRMTEDAAEDDGPDYSPDGKWLYFNSARGGQNQIWKMPAKGGKATQLTKDDRANWFPHPSPDGKWLVYISFPPGTEGHPRDKPVILRRMKPDGTQQRDLHPMFGGQGTMNVPSWSPDSRRFAFVEYSAP